MPYLQIPPVWLTRPVRVTLIGAGGTGSHLFGALAALDHSLRALDHPGGLQVTVFDPDRVSPTNIGRQAFWPAEIGQNKAIALVQRVNLGLGLDWVAVPQRFSTPSADFRDVDLLITAVDQARVRATLGRQTHALSYPLSDPIWWLDTGNSAFEAQVVLGHWQAEAGPDWIPNIFQLYPELARIDDRAQREPSCSAAASLARQWLPINRLVADTALTLLWRLFREGCIETHGAWIDLQTLHVRPLHTDPRVWASFGWTNPD
ncbi:MAG TPA: PRTRC system ThiF family protein [Candidatus Competibacter sp.]|uniref:UBA/THIF-type NAD/FAD binding protein n=1 Tax=Candidatus Competibacter denitrificans Run_A_D11 TaxID=1400863 RepID=W6M8P9_9GAMM|nr:PRTRC system ThiF family protein [Candidatus Competibacter denitrificans]CDI04361.1 putative UBA/THIF-type NAD/FAD binding protein [Candidatus Competibacter denitrificans Run_A_D11]HRC71954.1 PRTRC system ThiF family protein [Candidatus Competibacter sp.]